MNVVIAVFMVPLTRRHWQHQHERRLIVVPGVEASNSSLVYHTHGSGSSHCDTTAAGIETP